MKAEKEVPHLSDEEIKKMRQALTTALEIYGKGDPKVKQDALHILDGWGRIIFIVSGDGKRIGLELTERWERERDTDKKGRTAHP